ncbi:MAG: hypothetical protein HYR84_08470 [Planctomycetes bacterium]|nr:hypothetical protein [Planctomycetota bacterium]
MSLKITIHSTGTGACSLTGKDETDGLTVTFEDGTVQQAFLSWKGFRQLLSLKAKRAVGADPKVAGKVPDAKATQG